MLLFGFNDRRVNCGSVDEAIARFQENQLLTNKLRLEESRLKPNSQKSYRTYLGFWKAWCDAKYAWEMGRRYDICELKALRFFSEFMFKRETKKSFYANQRKDVITPYRIEAGSEGRTIDLSEVLEVVPVDTKGRRMLTIPCGSGSNEQALKAIIHLQK
ncbi:hypothetical protein BGZ54_002535 [Gamsiella multidivaricata]|nr:hypothetical protein BGZ54_002535 [Gamsiella multidivaricata]